MELGRFFVHAVEGMVFVVIYVFGFALDDSFCGADVVSVPVGNWVCYLYGTVYRSPDILAWFLGVLCSLVCVVLSIWRFMVLIL